MGDAAAITNNPENVVYKAMLPKSAFFEPAYPEGGNIEGEVTARAGDGGKGVRFTVKLKNLPATDGPFSMFAPWPPYSHPYSIYGSVL